MQVVTPSGDIVEIPPEEFEPEGRFSAERRNYYGGGRGGDVLYTPGYYSDNAWLYVLLQDPSTLYVDPSDASAPAQPIDIIDTGTSGGGGGDLGGSMSGAGSWSGPWG